MVDRGHAAQSYLSKEGAELKSAGGSPPRLQLMLRPLPRRTSLATPRFLLAVLMLTLHLWPIRLTVASSFVQQGP